MDEFEHFKVIVLFWRQTNIKIPKDFNAPLFHLFPFLPLSLLPSPSLFVAQELWSCAGQASTSPACLGIFPWLRLPNDAEEAKPIMGRLAGFDQFITNCYNFKAWPVFHFLWPPQTCDLPSLLDHTKVMTFNGDAPTSKRFNFSCMLHLHLAF